jgi:two-component system response regulator DctR
LRAFEQLETRLNRGAAQIDQKELDFLLQKQRDEQNAEEHLPKGLNPQMLEQVVALLSRSPTPLSAIETARELDVSRITARRYLEFLVAQKTCVLELE